MATNRLGETIDYPTLSVRTGKGTWAQIGAAVTATDQAATDQVFRVMNRAKLHLVCIQNFNPHQPFAVLFARTDHDVKGALSPKAGDDA